jgi:hypothetical protein
MADVIRYERNMSRIDYVLNIYWWFRFEESVLHSTIYDALHN